MNALRRTWRLPWAVALLLGGLFTVLLVFPLMSGARCDRTIAGWSRWLLRACGVRLRIVQPPAATPVTALTSRSGGRMLVANHISWIDIFVIDAIAPSCFIAKDDIARWPLIGTLVARAGTLFLARGKRHAVHQAIGVIAEQLRAGRRIAVFPEGTSGSGETLMPFHANLIEAAVQAGVPVDPVGLRYRGLAGESLAGPAGTMHFVGEISFMESFWRIIGAPGVWAEIHPLEALAPVPGASGNRLRHQFAAAARTSIAERLALPLADEIPDEVQRLRQRAA